MAHTYRKKLKTFDSLSDDLGDELTVELPEGEVVHGYQISIEKGTLDSGSYDNPDQVRDLLSNVETSIGGHDFTNVDGEALAAYHILNRKTTPQDPNTPSGAGREGQISVPFRNPVPVSSFNEKEIELDLRAIGDISGGTSQSGTVVEISAIVGKSGTMKQFFKQRRINKTFNSTGQERDTFELTGNLNYLLVHLDSADLDELEVNGVRSGAPDIEVVDVTKRQLKQATRNALPGDVDLPSGYYVVPLPQGGIDYGEIEFLELLPNINTTGDIEFFPTTLQELQNARSA